MYRLPVCVCLIRRMFPCDLTFHITTLAWAGPAGWGCGGAGARLAVPLSAQHRQAGEPHPHPLQSKGKHTRLPPHSTEAPVMATCILPHTPAGAFSRRCPGPVLNGCLPTSPTKCVCLGGKSRQGAGARAQKGPWLRASRLLDRMEGWEMAASQQGPCPHPASREPG